MSNLILAANKRSAALGTHRSHKAEPKLSGGFQQFEEATLFLLKSFAHQVRTAPL